MKFRILGSLESEAATGERLALGGPSEQKVLAVLLLNVGRIVPVTHLVNALWDDDPPATAAKQAQNTIGRLRRLLAGSGEPDAVMTESAGYRIRIDGNTLDARLFEAKVAQAENAASAGEAAEAAALLGSALDLWRGPLLAGMTGRVIEAAATAWDERRRAAQDACYQHLLALGRHRDIVAELAALLGEDPLREKTAAQLMLALYRCGRQPDALKAYQVIRGRLDDGLGLDPSPELQRLHQQILTRDPALDLPPGTAGQAPDASPGPSAVGSGTVPPVIPRQLPAAARHFAGRAGELKQLDELLNAAAGADAPTGGDGTPGTVVITAIGGTAGIGKTALAVHWAHQAAERFPDGQLYVNLRGYDPAQPVPPADALAGFLRALGVPGQDIPAGEDERAARYRSLLAGRRMLVILDNASQAEQVRPLLPGTPPSVVVVTSRDSLAGLVARDGAARLDLDLLPPEEAIALLRALIGARVGADPAAAATIAERCCRLPLALRVAAELAAARPGISLAGLAGELADQQRRLDLLEAGGDRRTAVRAVFSWSYRYLDAGAARAFRLAGLHPGPDLDIYAAAALTGSAVERAGDALDVLARAHLIQPASPGRYGMHDLLRSYARELAHAQDSEEQRRATLTRLFDHYLHTAATAMDALYPAEQHRRPQVPPPATPAPPVTDPAAARSWLDAERASLTNAAVYTADHGWPGHTIRLAATLSRYLFTGYHCPDAITIHSHARRATRHTGDRAAEATALNWLGGVDVQQGRYQQAADHIQLSLALHRETRDQSGEARALHNIGLVGLQQGHYQQAADHFQLSLALHRETGDRSGEARALDNLGVVEQRQGRLNQAAGHHRQALALFRETGDRGGEAEALNGLGIVDLGRGRCDQAAGHHRQALTLYRETGNRGGEAEALTRLAAADLRQGRLNQAAGHHRQALALFREIGDRDGEAEALNGLGEVFLATGQPGPARTQHAAALDLASQVGNKYEQARADHGLGSACLATGDPGQARHHWQEALTLYTGLGAPAADQLRALLSTTG